MPGGIILFAHFGPKNQARKVHKDIEPNQAFMYSFMCQTVLIFPIYIYIYIYIYISYSQKELMHFGPKILVYRVLAHFEPKFHKRF